MSLFNINSKFSTVYENCGKCFLKRHFQYKPNFKKIMEGVSSIDTFNIIPFFGNCERCLLTPSTFLKKLGLYWDTFHNVASIDGGLSV